MALLSDPAIALLRRLPSEWTDAAELALDTMSDRAWLELRREGLAEAQVWPPPDLDRRRYRARGRAIDSTVERRTQVRITGRGQLRLQRLRRARTRTPLGPASS